MIYNIVIRNDLGIDKQFYLTADTPNQLYHRAATTYGVTKDRITILEEYKELEGDTYKLNKTFGNYKKESEYSDEVIAKAKAAYADQKYKTDPSKTDYMTRHGLTEVVISCEKDVYPLAQKYKVVKIYHEPTEEKGVHRYYALVK